MPNSIAPVLTKVLDLCDWLVTLGLSEATADEVLKELCDVHGINYQYFLDSV